MAVELVTGFAGKAHITSLDTAKFNAGIAGAGEFVLPGVGDNALRATMVSSNKVRIASGNGLMQGRHFVVDALGVDLTVQTGTQGQNRNDLVVAHYEKNASTGIESVDLRVIKGTPTAGAAADPACVRGDILNGTALVNEMPLWRIPLSGITVGTPVQLFKTYPSMAQAWDSVSHAGELIWRGDWFLDGAKSISFPRAIDEYPNGIVLVWSLYTAGTTRDYGFVTHYVDKRPVIASPGRGYTLTLASSKYGDAATKYVYVSLDRLTGHDDNIASGTGASGVKYANNAYVLREVWGV